MEGLPVRGRGKTGLTMIVYPFSISVGIISAPSNRRVSIPSLVVLDEQFSLLARIKQPQVRRVGRFVVMGEGVFVPQNGCASVDEKRLANKQHRPPKSVPFHAPRVTLKY